MINKENKWFFFTHSLGALPWLLLSFFAMLFCHGLVNIDAPLFIDPISESQFLGESWDTVEPMWILTIGMISAITVNLLFLIIIPCFFGGLDGDVKHSQFIAGFIVNIILGFGLPLFFFLVYGLDNKTAWLEILPTHLVAFPVTFFIGSRFVSKNYRKRFRF